MSYRLNHSAISPRKADYEKIRDIIQIIKEHEQTIAAVKIDALIAITQMLHHDQGVLTQYMRHPANTDCRSQAYVCLRKGRQKYPLSQQGADFFIKAVAAFALLSSHNQQAGSFQLMELMQEHFAMALVYKKCNIDFFLPSQDAIDAAFCLCVHAADAGFVGFFLGLYTRDESYIVEVSNEDHMLLYPSGFVLEQQYQQLYRAAPLK